ncbi:MAG TPA: LLM class F420-dependent oxidoreductase [Acidimicrobiales bacterium]|nr:LLM class F420-dependent oxidoreductase [Acidimicrobiales bacterium]
MELGLHVADFTWTGGAPQLAPSLTRVAKTAEDAGFARLTVMDHFWQITGLGPPEHEMLEAYTTLGYLAAHTDRILLHTLVTGVVYREPGLLAKAVTTLDVLSGGRAGLGIGAAWNEEESLGLGLPFPPTAERFERLEETLKICLQMWSDSEEPFDGTHYHLGRTLSSPQNLTSPRPRIMIGGTGERKTLRLVARYADACNLFGGPEAAHKLDVLRGHCESEGRDYDDVEKTATLMADVSGGAEPFVEQLRALHELGFTVAYVMVPGPDPFGALDVLGAKVIPEIAGW